ncbi:sensor histidine kinase YesM [Paraliobacillus quinghaiensis]|uniref:histidine kinase n=1 Tax=Paraliobacillus quinghaiensis TaxID=470815 RepID=A0A917TMD6_9BACI|nr:histidine kinase [Paraliobacillus quinghaiensis]GGM28854.1 sensor histidine kinase YesM [Paraliobacillus quinghaiensis]
MYISNISLQKKFVTLYVIILLVPVLIFTWNISKQYYEASIHDAISENEYILQLEQVNIENNIETIRRTAQMVVANQEFKEFIRQKEEYDVKGLLDFKINVLSDITQLKYNNPSIENIHFFTSNKNISEMWPIVYDEKRIANSDWYKKLLELNGREMWRFNQQGQYLDNVYSSKIGPWKASLYRQLEYPKDNHLGIIEITMLLENFFPKMFSGVNNGQSQMLVIDEMSNVHVNPADTLLEELNTNPEAIRDNFFRDNKNDSNQTMRFQNRERPYLIVSSYVEGIDMHLLNVVSLKDIYAERNQIRMYIFIGAFALIIVLSLFTHGIISLILKKFHLLIELMKRVEKGDFTVDVDIRGHGEIGRLSNHIRNMLSKINSLIADSVNKEAATKESELKALKTQIDSHFLYNTLENIKMMAEIDGNYEISDTITSLGEMMRYNLKWKKDFVSLQDEVNHIKNYIDIMNVRLDNKLRFNVDIPSRYLSQEVLKMTFQPIVENSVKHGLLDVLHEKDGIISIKVFSNTKDIMIEITDNGVGMDKSTLCQLTANLIEGTEVEETSSQMKSGSGIGLYNVHERIQLHYGNEYGLKIDSEEGEYTKVVVTLPCLLLEGGGGLPS